MNITLFKLFDAFGSNKVQPRENPTLGSSAFDLNLEELLEKRAVVEQTIQPQKRGRVGFQGSWWPAICVKEVSLIPGEIVYVTGRCGITLLVEPVLSPSFSTLPDTAESQNFSDAIASDN
ncbi:NfeD family protein [Argonema antarcticum]|uniref:NfeD family protein n=1 Tax=Argonema antarcticum TaxID=2942763 RepID=UPI0020121577|nr:NfeD family protein [Argonema antarcticum]MCL1475767.1 NfeD family protein [Argonema antarcticum A004/B2]